MENLGQVCVLAAIRQLISSEKDPSAPQGWLERLSYNLMLSRKLKKSEDIERKIYEVRKNYDITFESTMTTGIECVYWDFITEGLTLLLVLSQLMSDDTNSLPPVRTPITSESVSTSPKNLVSSSTVSANPLSPSATSKNPLCTSNAPKKSSSAPKNLLSVADEKTLCSLLQFVSLLGTYPHLLPGVSVSLRARTNSSMEVNKFTHLSLTQRNSFLYKCIKMLLSFMNNPMFASLILTSVLRSDILAALIQIIYAPECSLRAMIPSSCTNIPGKVHLSGKENSQIQSETSSLELSNEERLWCKEQLAAYLNKVHQPILVQDLLLLQGAPKRPQTREGTPSWFRKTCGQLLSERLLQNNGLHYILRGIFDTTQGGTCSQGIGGHDDWRKCQAVAKIVSSCPSRAVSVDQYYSILCPQVLSLFTSSQEGKFLRVAVAILSTMLTHNYDLTLKYLLSQLLQPLQQLAGDCDTDIKLSTLVTCIKNIEKILLLVGSTSPFMSIVISYLPILFEVWRATRSSDNKDSCLQSSLTKSLIIQILKPCDTTTQLHFFSYLLRISSETQQSQNQFKKLPDTLVLMCGEEGLIVEDKLSSQVYVSDSELMEDIGSCLMELLLDSELQRCGIVGSLFLHCVKYLGSVLKRECFSLSEIQQTDSRGTREDGTIESGNKVLLEWEERTRLDDISEAHSFSSTLVLYITAAICEQIGDKILQDIDELSLVETLSIIVRCHAFRLMRKKEKILFSMEDTQEEITGGHVTLSIAFGLLSAIITAGTQISRKLRPILSEMLPNLEEISQNYSDRNLALLSGELKICIVTLGAVWTTNMQERAQQLGKGTSKKKEGVSVSQKALSVDTEVKDDTRTHGVKERKLVAPLIQELPDSSRDVDESAGEGKNEQAFCFQQALNDLKDPLLPVQAHGLVQLTRLVQDRDETTMKHIDTVLSIFKEHIGHSDSYIYLAAIRGLVIAASTRPKEVLQILCREYGQFDDNNKEKCSDEGLYIKDKSPKVLDSSGHGTPRKENGDSNLSSSRHLSEHNLQWRIKIGEALMKVVQDMGEMLPHFSNELMSSVLTNVQSSEPLLRVSALSNLADICSLMKFSFAAVQNEIVSLLKHVVQSDPDTQARQAAVTVIKQLFKGLDRDMVQVLGDSLLQLYRILKHVESTDPDLLTRTHAQAALGELDSVMREYLFPAPSFTKKISVLN